MRSEIFVKIFVFISLFLIYNSLNLQKQKDFSFLQTQMKLQTFSKFIEDYNEISIEFNKEENLDSDTLYAYYDKKNSKIIITKDENKEKEKNSKSNKKNLSKIALIQNKKIPKNSNFNNNIISSNYYSNNTNGNESNLNICF